MENVYIITQRAFFRSNGYEYQISTDFGRDCKMFLLERDAEDALYENELNYRKLGYTVVSADQSIKGDGQRMQYRLEKAGDKTIVLELWKKEVL